MAQLKTQYAALCEALAGVPYVHQGRTLEGMDCVGVPLYGVEQMGYDVSAIPNRYRKNANHVRLLHALQDSGFVKPGTLDGTPGQLLLFNVGGGPRHFGVTLANGYMIHAFNEQNVVITDLRPWIPMLYWVYEIDFENAPRKIQNERTTQ